MIYITKKGDLRAKIHQKVRWESVIRFFCYETQTTPTVKCHRWLNIICLKSTKVFHGQFFKFKYCFHLSFLFDNKIY